MLIIFFRNIKFVLLKKIKKLNEAFIADSVGLEHYPIFQYTFVQSNPICIMDEDNEKIKIAKKELLEMLNDFYKAKIENCNHILSNLGKRIKKNTLEEFAI